MPTVISLVFVVNLEIIVSADLCLDGYTIFVRAAWAVHTLGALTAFRPQKDTDYRRLVFAAFPIQCLFVVHALCFGNSSKLAFWNFGRG